MFSIAPLPDAAFAVRGAYRRQSLRAGQGFGECRFDKPPARGEIGVSLRKFNDAMEMLGQHHEAVYLKRMARPHRADNVTQKADVADQQIIVMPL